MAIPTSRDEFKEFCLRRLGKPVIEINVSDDQVDDRVDEALNFYTDWHYDAIDKTYYKHQIIDIDKTNRYITLPTNIVGAIFIYPISDPAIRQDDLFNIRYQIALNDLYTLTSVSMVPFYQTMQHLGIFEEILVGKQPIRFNRKDNIMYLDMDWDNVNIGDFLLVECYTVLDPDTVTSIWNDRMLQKLATAYIKRQWGENLMKFSGMQLPGNVTFNGEKIYEEGSSAAMLTEQEIQEKYQMPAELMIG